MALEEVREEAEAVGHQEHAEPTHDEDEEEGQRQSLKGVPTESESVNSGSFP